jgi:type-F conjugative transfer system pilin assembly protein TrbC
MLHVIQLLIISMLPLIAFAQSTTEVDRYASELNDLKTIELDKSLISRINTIEDHFNSEEFNTNISRFRSLLSNDELISNEKEDSNYQTDMLVLFISSSIPLPVLNSYAEQLDNIGGGIMVVNGFIGSPTKITPTLEFIASILNKDMDCRGASCKKYNVEVIIDPILFELHGVKRVPALTFYEAYDYKRHCQSPTYIKESHLVYGDASLKALAIELSQNDNRHSLNQKLKEVGYL